jgi:Ribosomal protein L7Ae/L30e/S12e/Gadd45 family
VIQLKLELSENKNKNKTRKNQIMCLLVENKQQIEKMGGKETAPNGIGQTVKCVLLRAQLEKRIVVGLNATVKSLAASDDGAVFCFVAPPKQGDAATLMHEVLLQAFCFENDIYVIKVRSLLEQEVDVLVNQYGFLFNRLTAPKRLADYLAPQHCNRVLWSTAPGRKMGNGKYSPGTRIY